MSKLTSIVSAAALSLFTTCVAVTHANAETTIEVQQAYGSLYEREFKPLADEFMKKHPDIKIVFRVSAKNYTDGYLKVVREALTGSTPDVVFAGISPFPDLVYTLQPRGQIADLGPLMEAEGQDWIKANYDDRMIDLGRIDGQQWALPFNISTPITYYNIELMKKAGLSTTDLPKTWDQFIAAAKKIKAADSNVDGIQINMLTSEWFWQSMVGSFGGSIMDAKQTKFMLENKAGINAATNVRRLVGEAEMPWIDEAAGETQFAAGRLGIFIGSTSDVRGLSNIIGDKFKWITGPFPMSSENGTLPPSGNVVAILTNDPEKKKAAWEFVKFVTSPEGQTTAVQATGYMPTNKRARDSAVLGAFYNANPNWTTSVNQVPLLVPRTTYPDGKSVKIWESMSAVLYEIGHGKIPPKDGIAKMVKASEAIISD